MLELLSWESVHMCIFGHYLPFFSSVWRTAELIDNTDNSPVMDKPPQITYCGFHSSKVVDAVSWLNLPFPNYTCIQVTKIEGKKKITVNTMQKLCIPIKSKQLYSNLQLLCSSYFAFSKSVTAIIFAPLHFYNF